MANQVKSFFDPETSTWTHLIRDSHQQRAAIIDPVLDYDPHSGRTNTASAEKIIQYVEREGLTLDWIIETHAHADHLSSAQYIKHRLGGRIVISKGIQAVQENFSRIFNLGPEFPVDGSQFDQLLEEGDALPLGDLAISAIATPGHTSDSMSLRCSEAVFIGDTLFSPGYGTARCDFPGGDAGRLYQSIQKLLQLPDDTRLYLCHDYPQAGQSPVCCTTVAMQRQNVHLQKSETEADFIAMRNSRDASLSLPRLLLPSVQVNIRAGHPPDPEDNDVSYLKIPLNLV